MKKKSVTILAVIIAAILILAGCTNNETATSETTIKYDLSQEEIETSNEDISILSKDGIQLADGVYTGSADAFGPDLTVEVTVENGLISNVTVISHNEVNSAIYGEAMELIPVQIVENQSLNVDAVSGATYTSYGIQNAVIDALGDALISGELPEQAEISSGGRRH